MSWLSRLSNVSSDDKSKALVIWQQLHEHIRHLPGVRGAGISGWGLFSGNGWSQSVRIPGQAPDSFEPHFLEVSPHFFSTMRIRVLSGREFLPRDSAVDRPAVAIVNETFAKKYFPGLDAVGQKFQPVDSAQTLYSQEIVGLVQDARYNSLREPAPPTVYVPLRAGRSLSRNSHATAWCIFVAPHTNKNFI